MSLSPTSNATVSYTHLDVYKRQDIDSGLHDFLSDDPVIAALAAEKKVRIRDIRKPPERKDLHFFSGKIEEVDCLKLAVLGLSLIHI